MTTFLAMLLMLVSIGVAVLGFVSIRSDIQIIIAIMGSLFAGMFLIVASIAATVGRAKRELEDVQDQLDETLPIKRKESAADFASAMALYQQASGSADGPAAIRALATDALRRQGYLQ